MLTFLQKGYNGIENQKEIDVIFTDYSKAFDRVDHGVLLKKLVETGIRVKLLIILKSYVTDRSQFVRVNNEFSWEIKITSGVPQGSIIAPLLFLVFVNDLLSKCKCLLPLMFADDAKSISIGTEPNLVQKDLNALLKWTETNHMPFNMEKCAHVSINRNEKYFYFGNHVIQKKLTQSDLGLIHSSDLKWDQLIEKACKKAIKVFFMNKRNVSNIYWTTKLNLYKSMIVPI